GGPGAVIKTAVGTIPAHVNPPGESSGTTGSTSYSSQVQVASATAGTSGLGSFFSNLFGSKSDESSEARSAAPADGAATKGKPASAPSKLARAVAKLRGGTPAPAPTDTKVGSAAPPANPSKVN